MLVIKTADSPEDRQKCFDLRHQVFVIEQKVPAELEPDEYDQTTAIHFLGTVADQPVATARLCELDGFAKLQRIAVSGECRGRGYGREIVQYMISHARQNNIGSAVALNAQCHATGFYEALGFTVVSDRFDDAGIPHVRMEQRF